ncbi:uncharacterized protein LOC135481076 [Liolophura sinensis]|uniref:uncharacterized protein LOC135481076 n=1 Tax=Liolophura sinensis TaxID=3198878 RepID=UPI003158092C
MWSICVPLLCSMFIGICSAGIRAAGHEGQSPGDSAVARTLFVLADENMDGVLSFAELHGVFKAFDLNNDNRVDEHEFISDWTSRGLGDVWEALTLFKNLDTDKNGAITEDPDLFRVQTYFDRDGDGKIIQSEFVIQWVKLSSS